jgi:hypothetical protein
MRATTPRQPSQSFLAELEGGYPTIVIAAWGLPYPEVIPFELALEAHVDAAADRQLAVGREAAVQAAAVPVAVLRATSALLWAAARAAGEVERRLYELCQAIVSALAWRGPPVAAVTLSALAAGFTRTLLRVTQTLVAGLAASGAAYSHALRFSLARLRVTTARILGVHHSLRTSLRIVPRLRRLWRLWLKLWHRPALQLQVRVGARKMLLQLYVGARKEGRELKPLQKGETLVIELELRDWRGRLLDGQMTVTITDPRGKETSSGPANPVQRLSEGRYAWSFPIPQTGPEGRWRIRCVAEKDGTVVVEHATFRVEG